MTNKFTTFLKNIALIFGATFLAQLLPIAISPLLTRMFTPEVFGFMASYLAIAGVIGIIATGRLENAILLPRSNVAAQLVARVVMTCGGCVAIITILVLLAVRGADVQFEFDFLVSKPLYFLLPLSVILTSCYTTLLFWTNRQKQFGTIATNRVIQATSTGVAQIFGGLTELGSAGLIGGVIAGQMLSLALLGRRAANIAQSLLRPPSRRRFAFVFKRYWRFPALDAPASLLILLSSQSPNILLAIYFSPATAGFFFLTQRVLQGPVTLIASAFLEVFRQRASKDRAIDGTMRPIFLQTMTTLFAISLPLSLVLYFTITDIFLLVFGEKWYEAGVYAQYLVPAMGLRLIANPLSFTLSLVGWQIVNLVGSMVLASMSITAILLADTARDAVMALSVVFCAVYFAYILLAYLASGR